MSRPARHGGPGGHPNIWEAKAENPQFEVRLGSISKTLCQWGVEGRKKRMREEEVGGEGGGRGGGEGVKEGGGGDSSGG